MPRIYVNFNGMESMAGQCKSMSNELDDIHDRIQNIIRRLDWDVRYEADINSSAKQIMKNLNGYSKAIKKYGNFLNDAKSEYSKIDNFKYLVTAVDWEGARLIPGCPRPDWKDLVNWENLFESFGTAGVLYGLVDKFINADSWTDWTSLGLSTTKVISDIAKDFNNYNKIGRAITTQNSDAYFWRNFFGLNAKGNVSKFSSFSGRFYNNLHMESSPYKISGWLDSFTGKNGGVSAAAAWGGVLLTGVTNTFDNLDEQKNSNGTMSNARVAAETVTETAISTAISIGGAALIGAGLSALTGGVAAPVVVAALTSITMNTVNSGSEAVFGVSAVEGLSDMVLDGVTAVGDAVSSVVGPVANWLGDLVYR